ncbi:uncharacterized protein LOC129580359 [Sitodiplosis mosellana]|uniref:uncharacterized protein LOC129580359 n=1 Tax=Sitodiplosis mosellana TaxID=263140 RepID=UPI002444C904|nr:uncharacterized protein LOC129580359 [Sitodiplosis mosellana]XP_055326676.1 uncharacterized protein LOC129580359 [Sitodiplosis mosellana]XP_055326677.1 uncharacterized protein LOC129580359 [Sitodiplosis mosellana]
MKFLVLILLTIAVAFAIPVELDSGDESQLTLVDLDNDQLAADDNVPDVARSKRFILKKIALIKAGALGVGALGLAGAAISAKSALGGGFNGGSNQITQGYGSAYGYGNSGPSLTTAYPSPSYITSQTYVPPQTYAPPPPPQPAYVQQQAYVAAPQPSFTGPINSALAWKAGIANNFVSGISSGFSNSVQQPVVGYSYGAPPPPPPQPIAGGPLPNKPVYVVCDSHN